MFSQNLVKAFYAERTLTHRHRAAILRQAILHEAEAEAYESQGLFDMAINEYREVLARHARPIGSHYRLGAPYSPAGIARLRSKT